MNRRDFIIGTGAGLGAVWPGSKMITRDVREFASSDTATIGETGILIGDQGEPMSEHPHEAERTYHVLGVPLRTGSLYPGNENDAQAYRDVHLLARLQAAGCKAVDDGDVTIPSYLPPTRSLR